MQYKPRYRNVVLTALALLLASSGFAFDFSHLVLKTASNALANDTRRLVESEVGKTSTTVPAVGSIEVAFSPNEGAEQLVIKAIESAQFDIHLMAYSFTSAPVTKALLSARHRGVNIKMVVDHKNNVSQDQSGKARAALSALATAGVDVRTISTYSISHDKIIQIDGRHIQLGSFNYSSAAATRNSENVMVVWDNPALAKAYLAHFERNYRQSVAYEPRY